MTVLNLTGSANGRLTTRHRLVPNAPSVATSHIAVQTAPTLHVQVEDLDLLETELEHLMRQSSSKSDSRWLREWLTI